MAGATHPGGLPLGCAATQGRLRGPGILVCVSLMLPIILDRSSISQGKSEEKILLLFRERSSIIRVQ